MLTELQKIASKISDFSEKEMNEENTKTRLIRPFFESLGWDFENIDVDSQPKGKDASVPEYHFKIDGKIVLIVEAKRLNDNLNEKKMTLDKLKYCSSHSFPLLVITNGNKYKVYFNDIIGPPENKLLFEFSLADGSYKNYFHHFIKNNYNLLNYAKKEKYRKYVKMSIESLLANPSPEFIEMSIKSLLEHPSPKFMEMINTNIIEKNIGLDKLHDDDIKDSLLNNEVIKESLKSFTFSVVSHNEQINEIPISKLELSKKEIEQSNYKMKQLDEDFKKQNTILNMESNQQTNNEEKISEIENIYLTKLKHKLENCKDYTPYVAYIATKIYPEKFEGEKMYEFLKSKFKELDHNSRGKANAYNALKQRISKNDDTRFLKKFKGKMYQWNNDCIEAIEAFDLVKKVYVEYHGFEIISDEEIQQFLK